MTLKYAVAVVMVGIFGLLSAPAHATLENDSAQAEVNYIGPQSTNVTGLDNTSTKSPGYSTVGTGVSFVSFATNMPLDFSVVVDPTQITITSTNAAYSQFCSDPVSGGCNDAVDELQFLFQSTAPVTGVDTANITGVTVDPATSSDFLPVTPIDLISPTEFTVNVENLYVSMGDKMILDLTFSSNPTTVPEPGTLALLAAGLLGLGFVMWRRRLRAPLA